MCMVWCVSNSTNTISPCSASRSLMRWVLWATWEFWISMATDSGTSPSPSRTSTTSCASTSLTTSLIRSRSWSPSSPGYERSTSHKTAWPPFRLTLTRCGNSVSWTSARTALWRWASWRPSYGRSNTCRCRTTAWPFCPSRSPTWRTCVSFTSRAIASSLFQMIFNTWNTWTSLTTSWSTSPCFAWASWWRWMLRGMSWWPSHEVCTASSTSRD